MKPTPDIETKKKREQFMIEIRKTQNDTVFKSRRTKASERPQNPQNHIDKDIEQDSLQKFTEFEKSLVLAVSTNNSEKVFEVVSDIRSVLNYHPDPNFVPWAAFLKTNLFDIFVENLREKNYYNQRDIKKEVLWWVN